MIDAVLFWQELRSQLGTSYFARAFVEDAAAEALISLHPPNPAGAGTGTDADTDTTTATMSLFLNTTHRGKPLLSLFEAQLSAEAIHKHFIDASMGVEDNLAELARELAAALQNVPKFRTRVADGAASCEFFLTYAGKPDVEGLFSLAAVQGGLSARMFSREKDWVVYRAAEEAERACSVSVEQQQLVLTTIEEQEAAPLGAETIKRRALREALSRRWSSARRAFLPSSLQQLPVRNGGNANGNQGWLEPSQGQATAAAAAAAAAAGDRDSTFTNRGSGSAAQSPPPAPPPSASSSQREGVGHSMFDLAAESQTLSQSTAALLPFGPQSQPHSQSRTPHNSQPKPKKRKVGGGINIMR